MFLTLFQNISEPSGSLFQRYKCVQNKIVQGEKSSQQELEVLLFYSLIHSLAFAFLTCIVLAWGKMFSTGGE